MTPFWKGFIRGMNMGTWPTAHLWIYLLTALFCASWVVQKPIAVGLLLVHASLPAWVLCARARR